MEINELDFGPKDLHCDSFPTRSIHSQPHWRVSRLPTVTDMPLKSQHTVIPDFHCQELHKQSTRPLDPLPHCWRWWGGEGRHLSAGNTRQLNNLAVQVIREEQLKIRCFMLHVDPLQSHHELSQSGKLCQTCEQQATTSFDSLAQENPSSPHQY